MYSRMQDITRKKCRTNERKKERESRAQYTPIQQTTAHKQKSIMRHFHNNTRCSLTLLENRHSDRVFISCFHIHSHTHLYVHLHDFFARQKNVRHGLADSRITFFVFLGSISSMCHRACVCACETHTDHKHFSGFIKNYSHFFVCQKTVFTRDVVDKSHLPFSDPLNFHHEV